jgi:hypothetical protein
MNIFYDQKSPNYLPKSGLQNTPENAFMHVYFYFYSVVKCGNRALGINGRIKKIFSDTKMNPNHHCREVIEGPPGGPYRKDFEREPLGPITAKFLD